VVITSQYDVEIVKQLLAMNIKKFGVFNGNSSKIDFFDYADITSFDKKYNKISLIRSNNSGSNTFALYKMIPEKIMEKYNVVLINENNKEKNYYLDLIKSKLVVHTHSNYFDSTQINVHLWHGFPLKTLSYMSNLPCNIKIQRNIQWSKLKAIISYSQTYSTLMNACYGLNGNKYIVTGMPRNDLLLRADGNKVLSELLKLDLINKKIIFYMPTFRETIYGLTNGNTGFFNIFQTKGFDLKILENFLQDLNLIIVIKYHPFHKVINYINNIDLKNIYILEDLMLQQFNVDLYEIINAADLLITDYSSIYFDYLLLDKPIIFTPIDFEEYRQTRGLLVEPYDFWAPGPKCFTFSQLIDEIKKSLSDNNYYKKERETICKIVHHYKDANSSQRVWKLIEELMDKK